MENEEFEREHPGLKGKTFKHIFMMSVDKIGQFYNPKTGRFEIPVFPSVEQRAVHETQIDKQKVKDGFDKVACEGRLCEDCCHDSSCGFQDLRKEIGINTNNTDSENKG